MLLLLLLLLLMPLLLKSWPYEISSSNLFSWFPHGVLALLRFGRSGFFGFTRFVVYGFASRDLQNFVIAMALLCEIFKRWHVNAIIIIYASYSFGRRTLILPMVLQVSHTSRSHSSVG